MGIFLSDRRCERLGPMVLTNKLRVPGILTGHEIVISLGYLPGIEILSNKRSGERGTADGTPGSVSVTLVFALSNCGSSYQNRCRTQESLMGPKPKVVCARFSHQSKPDGRNKRNENNSRLLITVVNFLLKLTDINLAESSNYCIRRLLYLQRCRNTCSPLL